jgi:hypothetical protein
MIELGLVVESTTGILLFLLLIQHRAQSTEEHCQTCNKKKQEAKRTHTMCHSSLLLSCLLFFFVIGCGWWIGVLYNVLNFFRMMVVENRRIRDYLNTINKGKTTTFSK